MERYRFPRGMANPAHSLEAQRSAVPRASRNVPPRVRLP